MKHYLFNDLESGEDFIVGADTIIEAFGIANDYFEEPKYICELTDFEAELSGLDEY